MDEYTKIRVKIEENLKNPNDKQVCDWLEKNIDICHKYFDKTTEKLIDDDAFDAFDAFMRLDYLDYEVYKLIYGLFSRLTSTPKNAEIIHYIFAGLSDVLVDRFKHTPVTDNEISDLLKKWPDLLKKWRNKKNIKHEDYLYFYMHKNDYEPTLDDKFKKIEKEMSIEEAYIFCRFYLARTYNFRAYNLPSSVFEEFENSDDVALRMTYYKENNFNWSSKYHLTKEKLAAYYSKDGILALDCIVDNLTIYYRNEHLKLVIRSTGHIPTLNQFMENYNKVQNRKKESWELARELVEKIEKEELEEKSAEAKLKKQQKLETALIEIHNKITNLSNIMLIGLIILFIGLVIL